MCVQGREWGSDVPSGPMGSPGLQFQRQWDKTGLLGGASRTSCLPKPQKREACLQKRGYPCTACWGFSWSEPVAGSGSPPAASIFSGKLCGRNTDGVVAGELTDWGTGKAPQDGGR